ncbi:arylamine N-acetyltransferase [Undibacterium sp. Jales W-56]|uniref:arylamine N-acetyltransferase family protein n=1 Tax=Undibacterium sp. Jales W-56 TaxID=2897325 RepID=UPI0021D321BD|nr:arylamine N-acetyltransferase [Undibacterium sp. Jales W-56]MCU6432510.1 arylamine N-acetyltransferase [Undibacterium sp. Jales W-56]
MLTEAQVRAYLQRLGCSNHILDQGLGRTASKELFFALHLAHLHTIPFENLDIALGKKISLHADDVFRKLITKRRGGFCYELNYAFFLLLTSLGFGCRLLSARVYNGTDYGLPFDHLLLSVGCEEALWIADVGFGDCFRTPLRLNAEGTEELGVTYRVSTADDAVYVLERKSTMQDWQAQYQFTLAGHEIGDFAEMCTHQQTSESSHFTKKSICSMATKAGRTSLSNDALIITEHGVKRSHQIADADDYIRTLQEVFQIALPEDVMAEKLFKLNC